MDIQDKQDFPLLGKVLSDPARIRDSKNKILSILLIHVNSVNSPPQRLAAAVGGNPPQPFHRAKAELA